MIRDGHPEAPTRWADLRVGGNLPRFLVLCLGVWLHAADVLLVATVMPSAVKDIGGIAYMSWAISLYDVASIVAMAATANLALRLGLRGAMGWMAAVYALGCLASALAPSMAVMLFGRLLQGLGGGALVALACVAVARLFPERLMPRLMALISAIWGVSALCGPLIGGAFASAGWWRGGFWAFALQAGVLLVAALLLLRAGAGNRRDEAVGRVPWARLAMLAVAIVAVAEAGARVSLLWSVALVIVGLALFWLCLRRDAGAEERLLPRGALDPRRSTGVGLMAVFLLSLSTMSLTVYGPLLLTVLHGADPLVGGYLVALESAAWSAGAIACAGAGRRAEPWLIRMGALSILLGLVGLGFAMTPGPVLALVPWALLQGVGFGLAWAFMIRRVVAGAAADDSERAASALPTLQLVGYALGSSLCGMVANALGFADGVSLEEARIVGFWVFAAFLPPVALGVVAAWRLAGPLSGRTGGEARGA